MTFWSVFESCDFWDLLNLCKPHCKYCKWNFGPIFGGWLLCGTVKILVWKIFCDKFHMCDLLGECEYFVCVCKNFLLFEKFACNNHNWMHQPENNNEILREIIYTKKNSLYNILIFLHFFPKIPSNRLVRSLEKYYKNAIPLKNFPWNQLFSNL